MENYRRVSTGHPGLDGVVDELRLGDNVVWQVDSIADYRLVVEPYVSHALAEGRRLHYVRYARHERLVPDAAGVRVWVVDPAQGFEGFATAVHRIVADAGVGAFFVFDCLSDLLDVWHSDLSVMNFFKVTCPFLFELDTIAYFALLRNEHTFETIAGIRGTTQLLLDLYDIDGSLYVHPLKVWERYSPGMFFPHQIIGDEARSITSSGASAALFAKLSRKVEPPEPWERLLREGWAALAGPEERREYFKELLVTLLLGGQGAMGVLCRRYLTLEDLLVIASREIGTGAIGGKSVGMLVARAILEQEPDHDFGALLEAHDSYYLGSDLFFTYIIANGWWKMWTEQKSPEGYYSAGERLHGLLAHGEFPRSVRERFLQMLEYFGQSPIIVRSSSLLEDNFGNAFAGKYESVFCANQGTPEDRHRALEDAVRTVYASAMSAEALHYREVRGMKDSDEQMAILVQRVSGDHHGDLFFPHAAGVGNSSNLYVWDPTVDPEAGMVRLVLGLGTRAVDRTNVDYPRIVTLDNPHRTQYEPEDAARYSQHQVDVISLGTNTFTSLPVDTVSRLDVRADWGLFLSPDLHQVRRLRDLGRPVKSVPRVLDFHGLLSRTSFAPTVRSMMRTLEDAYAYPVDVEFTLNMGTDGDFRVNLVQCRPLQTRGNPTAIAPPNLDDPGEAVFATRGHFMGGNVRLPLTYVVLVRPEAYLALGEQDRYAVARQVGAVNKRLKGATFLIMGPGRWGTTTPSLGVPTHFTELSNASALVEFTYGRGNFQPELSYGSHFFLDLVEFDIFYAAVFDGQEGVVFDQDQVVSRENLLSSFDPASTLAHVVHVARFDDLVLSSDVLTQRAVCRREPARPSPHP